LPFHFNAALKNPKLLANQHHSITTAEAGIMLTDWQLTHRTEQTSRLPLAESPSRAEGPQEAAPLTALCAQGIAWPNKRQRGWRAPFCCNAQVSFEVLVFLHGSWNSQGSP